MIDCASMAYQSSVSVAMQNSGDHCFVCVDLHVCPVCIFAEFFCLHAQVGAGHCEDAEIVSICEVAAHGG